MNDSATVSVAACDQCGGPAEPPLTPVFDPFEMRVAFHVCQACVDALADPAGDAQPGCRA
jgi:hypothetical protein